jgi:hypothetical protein
MSIISELANLNPSRAAVAGCIIALLLPPGILSVYVFDNNLFASLDVFKLLLLSLSFSTAIAMLFVVAATIPTLFRSPLDPKHTCSAMIFGLWAAAFYSYVGLSRALTSDASIKDFVSAITNWVTFVAVIMVCDTLVSRLRRRQDKMPNGQKDDPSLDGIKQANQ